jgi:hypothetical protein
MRIDIWAAERERAEVQSNGVRVLCGDDPPTVKIWAPKGTKPAANYRFRSREQRQEFIDRYMRNHDAHTAAVVERRQSSHGTDEQRALVKVGAIFVYSWGWEQTNVDYFQVVEVKGGGATVVVRQIGSSLVPNWATGHMTGYVTPEPDNFLDNDEPRTKRVRFNDNGPYLSMDYSIARPWNGQPDYRSWYA